MATETVNCETCNAPFERRTYGFKPKNCPDCRPKPAAKPAADAVSLGGLTADQLQAILQGLSQQNMEVVRQFAEELRRPDEEMLRKRAEDQAKKDAARAARLREIKAEEEARAARVAACASNQHRKENGHSAISGQTTTGSGLFQPMCIRCGHLFAPISPSSDLAEGVTSRTKWKFGEDNLTIQ